ncbi:dipeptide ABC transporter ATP-binding protein DppD [Microvirga sp. KLBC 81]|uniref:ABC transporter ATP-binding protein n=1 Tax=Microvirga sp. KLBC 81 TaxID=1862707 RepID=UPI000D51723C|nr:ABC transporter ATP-binding protein [Microvirga sp. KLBC 81]PVE24341.1 dipeptide ABC transporter ATP-binding protein DppD [Microvirga sp. KLBC 81]
MDAPSLLSIQDLEVRFRTEGGEIAPVRGVTLSVSAGETVALVGESGSGKSVTSLATMGLLPRPAGRVSGGKILFRQRSGKTVDLATLPLPDLRKLRGAEIAMIFQEPMTSLNPVLTVGEQIAESVRLHMGLGHSAALKRAEEMLDLVEIPNARRRVHEYPHQMSGGMRQRVMIALAMSCNPSLLIADEPTTALDVTIQAQILALIQRLQREIGMGVLFITHNLGVVAEIADRVTVMYAGQVVETGSVGEIFRTPRHPYTSALLNCLPARARRGEDGRRVVQSIPGSIGKVSEGCAFAPRCSQAADPCRIGSVMLEAEMDRSVRCLRWRETLA